MTTIKLRRGTAAQWSSANPILAAGEPGFETDTGKEKIGNGTSLWSALSYFLRENHMDAKYALIGSGGGGTFNGNADNITDGVVKVSMLQTERTSLSNLKVVSDGHTADITGLEAAQSDPVTLDRLPVGGLFVVDKAKAYYGAVGAWPTTRPSARLDLVVLWLGATDPGTIAIAGDIIDLVG